MTLLTRFALRRPLITILLMTALSLGGMVGFVQLNRELGPFGHRLDDARVPAVAPFDFDERLVLRMSLRSDRLSGEALQRRIEDKIIPALEALDGVDRVAFDAVRPGSDEPPSDSAEAAGVDEVPAPKELAAAQVISNDGLRAAPPASSGSLSAAAPSVVATDAISSADSVIGVFADILPDPNAPRRPVFPLPAKLQEMNFRTTADLSPEVVRMLRATSPSLLEEIVTLMLSEMSTQALAAIDPDVAAELPDDLRQRVASRLATNSPTADLLPATPNASAPLNPVSTPPAPPAVDPPATTLAGATRSTASATLDSDRPAVRTIAAADGDTLAGLAERFGADPDLIRRHNGLTSDALTAGDLIEVPLPALGTRLPPAWRQLGAADASEITEAILAKALAERPQAVSDLTPEHLLALPSPTLLRLPLPVIMRQPDAVRREIMVLVTGYAAPALPSAMPAAVSVPPLTPTAFTAPTLEAAKAVAARGTSSEAATTPRPAEGKAELGLSVLKIRTANAGRVAEAVLAELGGLQEADGDWVQNVVFDQATMTRQSFVGVQNEGVLAALFAALVVLVFLRSISATLVAAVGIPVSALAAFALMRWQGLSLNLFSLAGLAIVVGRVVDDAVVVLESAHRSVQRGEDIMQAVLEGTSEVARAVAASSLVACAVVLPLGVIGVLPSPILRSFALAIACALLASLLVVVTLVPVLAKRLLTKDQAPQLGGTTLQRAYAPLLRGALEHRGLTLTLSALVFAASVALALRIPAPAMPLLGASLLNVKTGLPLVLGDLAGALPISILAAYLIMAVAFGSLVHPLTILFCLPFAASGGFIALALLGRPPTASSLIGLAMLTGIVLANAIALVFLVQQYRSHGVPARESLILGGRARLRPVLMTALAISGALATTAAISSLTLGVPAGALVASELAAVVVGGLVTGTAMTLIVVPVVYSLLDGVANRMRG